ncbi:MAG: hypothetical protein LBG81_04680, partial [Coriobacteriaceae bacterium]|nr:hypothetical protein [Coriobacteriaceae bacterium]
SSSATGGFVPEWALLVKGILCHIHAPEHFVAFIECLYAHPRTIGLIAPLLVWVLKDIEGTTANDDAYGARGQALEGLFPRIVAYLERRSADEDLDFFDAMLVSKVDNLSGQYGRKLPAGIADTVLDNLHKHEMSLFKQRKKLIDMRSAEDLRRDEYRRTHPDRFRADALAPGRVEERIAPLNIRLFGGLEVSIGDQKVDPALLSRQKVKILLAFLVLDLGKEISRERLCRLLWPYSDSQSAQRNLYTLSSVLRKALRTGTRSCPYLVRTQFSYLLDAKLVRSDVAELEKVCSHLMEGYTKNAEWIGALTQVRELYRGVLLPTEVRNEAIVQARKDHHNRVVDALSLAALRLNDMGDLQAALLFAHTALSMDSTREEVYVLLMKAQIALGQRSAALETYFRCQRYLSEELGIDPAKNTRLLYQGLITEDMDEVRQPPARKARATTL